MSVHSVDVHVVVVASGAPDGVGPEVARRLEAAGHRVVARLSVGAEPVAVTDALVALAEAGAAAIVVVGGTTVFEGRPAIDGAHAAFDGQIDAFGALAVQVAFSQVGAAALWLEAVAGRVGRAAVFVVPAAGGVAATLIDDLVAPQLAAAVGWALLAAPAAAGPAAGRSPSPPVDELGPDPQTQDAVFEEVTPGPGGFGRLGRGVAGIQLTPQPDQAPPPLDADASASGWLRAVAELSGQIDRERREELPQPVERLAPFVDVLHQAGEQAVLRLPSGVRYSLWGFPDLRRPNAKVLAVGWGQPLAEVIALHRYPVRTGTCIDEAHGVLGREAAGPTCEAVTGRAPAAADRATVFAVDGDAVYLMRDGRVSRWDGRKESEMGTSKQALASLALGWSQR